MPAPARPHRLVRWSAPVLLLGALAGAAVALGGWKQATFAAADAAAASQPEPVEAVTAVSARRREHQRTATAVGTVRALRSITLRNELPGTVREVHLEPGVVVEAGTVLVALDTSVEEAELAALEAAERLAGTLLDRVALASESNGASEADVDRARAERDVAAADVQRLRALVERHRLRAPFRARVGLADVHPGQYLDAGTALTTLQGVADSVHVDFAVAQEVAAELAAGDRVSVSAAPGAEPVSANLVALDSRVDSTTRNVTLRARVEDAARLPGPGAAVRVVVPVGAPTDAVTVPVSALRRGPAGDHVFVLEPDADGALRAHERRVRGGAMLGDEVVVESGLDAGTSVAASGSFKLYEGVRVVVADPSDSGRAEG